MAVDVQMSEHNMRRTSSKTDSLVCHDESSRRITLMSLSSSKSELNSSRNSRVWFAYEGRDSGVRSEHSEASHERRAMQEAVLTESPELVANANSHRRFDLSSQFTRASFRRIGHPVAVTSSHGLLHRFIPNARGVGNPHDGGAIRAWYPRTDRIAFDAGDGIDVFERFSDASGPTRCPSEASALSEISDNDSLLSTDASI